MRSVLLFFMSFSFLLLTRSTPVCSDCPVRSWILKTLDWTGLETRAPASGGKISTRARSRPRRTEVCPALGLVGEGGEGSSSVPS